MIHVVATVQLFPGRRADFITEFQRNVPHVLAEEGCLEYAPTIDVATAIPAQGPPRPDVVTVVEKWASLAALNAHLVAPHMLAYRDRVKAMVQGVTLMVLAPA